MSEFPIVLRTEKLPTCSSIKEGGLREGPIVATESGLQVGRPAEEQRYRILLLSTRKYHDQNTIHPLLPGEVDPIRRRRSHRNLTQIHHSFNDNGETPIDLPPERLGQSCLSFFRQARGSLLSRTIGQYDQRGSKRALHRKSGAC